MIGYKRLIIDKDCIKLLKDNKSISFKDIHKNPLRGKFDILLINNRMEIISTPLEKYTSIEKIVNENFYNPKEKLFHYVKNKKENKLILYSIDKPIILDNLMDKGRINSIKPYEFILLKKYSPKKNIFLNPCSPKKKSVKKIVIHSEFRRIFLLGIEDNQLIFCKNIDTDDMQNLNQYIKIIKSKINKDEDEDINFDFGNVDREYFSKIINT